MSDFLSNLIHRHLGTCMVVEPRAPSRFEIGLTDSEIRLSMDPPDMEETGDKNRDRGGILDQFQGNHADRPAVHALKPRRADTEVKSPRGRHAETAEPLNKGLMHTEDAIRPVAYDSIFADQKALEMKAHRGAPSSERRKRQLARPNPAEQKHPHEEIGPRIEIHRQSSAEIENRTPPPGNILKGIAGTNPAEEAHAYAVEFEDGMESGLPNRIGNTLASLQGHSKGRPAEYPKTDKVDGPAVAGAANTEDAEKSAAAQPSRESSFFIDTGKTSAREPGPKQPYAFDLNMPGTSGEGLLGPPTRLFGRQAEFSRRWKELSRKAQPEPVIHVTIGRIEVKATNLQKPKQPRHEKKPSGIMSLDKYLNQFGRGGRG